MLLICAGCFVVFCLFSGQAKALQPGSYWWRIAGMNGEQKKLEACLPQYEKLGPSQLSAYVSACRTAYRGDGERWTCQEAIEDGKIEYRCSTPDPTCGAYCGKENLEQVPFKSMFYAEPTAKGKVCLGRPIYPLTGSKRQSEVLGFWLGQSVAAVYDTIRKVPTVESKVLLKFGGVTEASFGGLWASSVHRRLRLSENHLLQGVQASRGGHDWVSFYNDGTGHFTNKASGDDSIVPLGNDWLYNDAFNGSQEYFNERGTLMRVNYSNGTVLTYTYSDESTSTEIAPSPGLLIKIQDQFGRHV